MAQRAASFSLRQRGEDLPLQVILSVSGAATGRPDSGAELDSHMDLKSHAAGQLGSPLPVPEMLLGLKEGDRRLIICD